MSDLFENCVWEELTVEQLEKRLEPEVKRGQEYLARMRRENTNPKHSYEDNGRYLMYMILHRDTGGVYVTDDGFPVTDFTLKGYVYPSGLQEVCDKYYIDSIGHVGKEGGMWLKTKEKNP